MKFCKKMLSLALALVMLCSVLVPTAVSASYSKGVFVFDNADDISKWFTLSNSLDYSYAQSENALKLTVTGGDPYILFDIEGQTSMSAGTNKAISIVYKVPYSASGLANKSEVFLSCRDILGPTAGYSVLYNITKGNDYVVQTIDLSDTSWWSGKIHNLRLDPFTSCQNGDTMYVDSIIIASDTATAAQAANKRLMERMGISEDRGDLDCTSYENVKYDSPLWKGNIIYNEVVFPEADRNGNLTFELMYEPDEIITVHDGTYSAQYLQGVDFTVEGNKLTLLKTGSIKWYAYDYIHPQTNPNNLGWYDYYTRWAAGDGKWELNFKGLFGTDHLNVTYTHSDTWDYYIPESKSDLLPNTTDKLISGESMNVVFFGDSICGGAEASSYRDRYPYADSWTGQITTYLEEQYGASINEYIVSVGGSTSEDMVKEVYQVTSKRPDLVFIEFGVNDGMNLSSSHPSVSGAKSDYKNAIDDMIYEIKNAYPECEVVLVSPFYPNIYCHYMEYFEAYEEALFELQNDYDGVAVADLTALMRDLLQFKTYTCFNGDNQCHPNDFGMRLLAQTCLATIIPEELGYEAYVPEEMRTVAIESVSNKELVINETGAANTSVKATGGVGKLTYKWTYDALPEGVTVYGDNTSNLVITINEALKNDISATFTCTVTDENGSSAETTVSFTYTAPEEPQVPGDLDGSGRLNISDFFVLKNVLYEGEFSDPKFDINGDGALNISDLFALRRMME